MQSRATSLDEALWQDPERMGDALCFRGTRIPVLVLFDYLRTDGIAEFFTGYPDVTPEQVDAVLGGSQAALQARFALGVAA